MIADMINNENVQIERFSFFITQTYSVVANNVRINLDTILL